MRPDLLASPGRRRALFALLYVTEGAPIGYLWTALPTKLRQAGVPVEDVAALASLITLPWTLKFLWAPLVDAMRSRSWGLRPWIVGAQLAMAATLLPLAGLDLVADYELLLPLLLVHAVCAATQDVSIDALAVKHVPPAERGSATGWMQLGMVLGKAVFGGVALAAEAWLGADVVVFALVAAIAASSLLALLARDHGAAGGSAPRVGERVRGFVAALGRVLRRRTTWLGLAFAALGGAAMEATGGLAGPLLVDRGLSQAEVGRFFAVPAVVGMAAGVLLGGHLADRFRRVRAVAGAVVAMALVAGVVAWTADAARAGSVRPLVVALGVAYVLFGVLTAASFALLMDLTDPALGGTQFSAYMGAVNLCYVWSAWSAGALAGRFDYPPALLAVAGASLLALPLLPRLRRHAARLGPLSAGGASAPQP